MARLRKHYKDSGTGEKVVILLPGFPASLRYWTSTQRYLIGEGYRVISIDLLGLGAAPKPRRAKYDYADHIDYTYKVIEGLGLDKNVSIIGHSMGALLGARYAVEYPSKINSLILLNPPLYMSEEEAYETLRDTGRLYRFMLDSKFRGIAWTFARIATLGIIARHTRMSRDSTLSNIVQSAEIFTDLDAIQTPTLLLVGLKDRPEYLKNIRSHTFAKNIVVRIENVSHHSPLFYKTLLRPLITDFLSRNI
ncbi:alpha/beta hydrolase [Patescibacteria group bacterium]|nr:MAG: alpha/beta hydrolase [Patescibacteria group bacterium]